MAHGRKQAGDLVRANLGATCRTGHFPTGFAGVVVPAVMLRELPRPRRDYGNFRLPLAARPLQE